MRENMAFGFLNLAKTSLKMMFSSSVHLPANNKMSFFFMAEKNPLYINTKFS
jgi:hypothetical protein